MIIMLRARGVWVADSWDQSTEVVDNSSRAPRLSALQDVVLSPGAGAYEIAAVAVDTAVVDLAADLTSGPGAGRSC